MAEELGDFRKNERTARTKTFAVDQSLLTNKSTVEAYQSIGPYAAAQESYTFCIHYAQAYSIVMLRRLEKENPDFFEENNTSISELSMHLTNNMCMPQQKHMSR